MPLSSSKLLRAPPEEPQEIGAQAWGELGHQLGGALSPAHPPKGWLVRVPPFGIEPAELDSKALFETSGRTATRGADARSTAKQRPRPDSLPEEGL